MKRSSFAKPRVRVVWDEENLDFLEASKTPKQKITEPKTPYYAPNTIDGVVSPTPDDEKIPMETALHAEAIRHALSEVASSSKASSSRQSGGGWSSGDDELDEMEQEGLENGRRWSFEEHRRVHYDEYRKAKWLKGHSDAEDEDDSEEREVKQSDEGASGGGPISVSGCSGSQKSCRGLDCDASLDNEMGKIDLQEKPLVPSLSIGLYEADLVEL
ncbi:unnamed protein product [Sphagnum troendelagicum]|uniref:Protein phosphatase inhibitor 2 n=1 Tax=Sphagnum troendelagicum TaxID=128251 RepID=A0ABP0TUC2_9BRYO